jgi:hypothetical protein
MKSKNYPLVHASYDSRKNIYFKVKKIPVTHPGSGKNSSLIRISDSGDNKAPDPGSGYATLA